MNSPLSPAWVALAEHQKQLATFRMSDAFVEDAERASRFTLDAAGLVLDYSKHLIRPQTMSLLTTLAAERGVTTKRDAMMAGERINTTENRAVLHMALRNPIGAARTYAVDGVNVAPLVQHELAHMREFTERVRNGEWRGYTGREITDVVNIGIGGSDLGPQMVCEAMRRLVLPRMTAHFVSNVDGAHLESVLARVNPETTLFTISSKTFTTQETIMNAKSARAWFLARGGTEADVAKHFVAVSTNTKAVREFGIAADNVFGFWDWVGGRYSLWSAVGLTIALAIGMDGFDELLAGAHAMDEHFATAPLEFNMPVVLGMLGVWYNNFWGTTSHCIKPYAQDLHRLPAYLQQLEMESNGKSVDLQGNALTVPSCPVIWGEPGTNGQHAFFQLLHQGTSMIPVDFIAALDGGPTMQDHHRVLLANCFAQSEALMVGKSAAVVRAELAASGMSPEAIDALTPHKVFHGNRPSSTILLPEVSPRALGALIALYEHKVFTQGVIWNVNSFDQWGVELGKQLAKKIDGELQSGNISSTHDGSTQALMRRAIR